MSNLLTGHVVTGDEISRLLDLNNHLSNQLNECKAAFARMKMERDAMFQACTGLRKILAPLWGELENVPVGVDVVGVPASNSRLESVKKRMPGKPAELIDLLQEHGPLSVTNIITIARWGKNSVYQTVSKLMQAGIVVNNGGKYTLKEQ
jgi:hypothetical protein